MGFKYRTYKDLLRSDPVLPASALPTPGESAEAEKKWRPTAIDRVGLRCIRNEGLDLGQEIRLDIAALDHATVEVPVVDSVEQGNGEYVPPAT